MNFFHKYFTSHEQNDFTPHPVRHKTVLALGSVVIALFLVVLAGKVALQGSSLTALVLPRVLIDATNADRRVQNQTALVVNPLLEKAAQAKANDMAAKGYFSHNSPDGKTPWFWFDEAGYNYKYAGENLAIDFDQSADVETAWMNSPEHRANILNYHYSEIGIATAPGLYEGHPTTYIVELFGYPALSGNWSFNLSRSSSALSQATTTTAKPFPTTRVLGESSSKDNLYIAVERVGAAAAPIVAPVPVTYSAPIERALFSSSKLFAIAYALIAIFIFLSLAGLARSEYKKHHLPLAALSVLLLVLMVLLLVFYHKLILDPILPA